MFTYEYTQKGSSAPGVSTILKASFRFKDEVAPENRGQIWNRLMPPNKNNNCSFLNEYLEEVEMIRHNSIFNGNYYELNRNKDRKISLSRHKFRLGLDILVISKKELGKRDMLDLEKLNKFILTGEK
jgi:hypothetical protein